MEKKELLTLLNDMFDVPLDSDDETDLTQYIQDSIDVGELIAELKHQHPTTLKLADFKNIKTLNQLLKLIQKHQQ